ncbi:hypothetical protein K443DRAFT_135081 [Laccaria amethystina LaAM-08-1]|uniref:Uncharacterized protein n=1 Tax=Laccaria amethystina LaAM-08-1 TaxID=1095629 RepID=A0A0C9WQ97_9AGAR|nr:hypothetical protein K443DRAFT_135081 [Laccaria amethystina LaAM-08-1]
MTSSTNNDTQIPSISLIRSSTPFSGEKLSKGKGNYRQWYKDMLIHLMGTCLFDYNWLANDRQTWSIIAGSINISERSYIKQADSSPMTAKKAWDSLKLRHENEGPIRQVNLLQKALAAKFTKDNPLPETARQICEDIKHAFTIGTLNEDLLCCIALINTLEDFPHLCTNVSTSLTNSKQGSYTAENILLLLENEQGLRDTDLMKKNRNNHSTIESTVLAGQTQPKSSNAPCCSGCKRTRHTNEYCIMPGGGMAGKTIAEGIGRTKKEEEIKLRPQGKSPLL